MSEDEGSDVLFATWRWNGWHAALDSTYSENLGLSSGVLSVGSH